MNARSLSIGLCFLLCAGRAAVQADQPMLRGLNGWSTIPILTIGQEVGGYWFPGSPDGLGAYAIDANTVRVLVSHEIPSGYGAAYQVAGSTGSATILDGGRVSYLDLDRATRTAIGAGVAITSIRNRQGNLVNGGSGLGRLCAGRFWPAGTATGLADPIYLTGEEVGNGTILALDISSGEFWRCPDLGYGNWENAVPVPINDSARVAFLLGDDAAGAPLYLYVGQKNPGGDFLGRNGMRGGTLFAWRSDTGEVDGASFSAENQPLAGHFVALTVRDPAKAGLSGYDSEGYALAVTLRAEARAAGAFRFARPEDLGSRPTEPKAVFVATGGSNGNSSGAVCRVDIDGSQISLGVIPASLTILWNCDLHPYEPLRRPDNLEWTVDGQVFLQEDGSAPNSVSRLAAGTPMEEIARMDQSSPPAGQFTGAASWESSGILDVSALFGEPVATLFIVDVQAHGLYSGDIATRNLVEGGQILFLTREPPVPVPTITSPSVVLGRAGQPFLHQLTSVDAAAMFSVTGLPSWAALDSSGLVTGQPSAPELRSMVVEATNSSGVATRTVRLIIRQAEGSGPTLADQIAFPETGCALLMEGALPGFPYALKRSFNAVDWETLQEFTAASDTMTLADPNAHLWQRAFYRVDY